MVLSLLPTSVLAAEGDPPATTEYVSGGCTVSFTDEDGDGNYTATVKAIEGGDGKMATYAMYDKVNTAPDTVAPWIKDGWNEFTTKIVIDDSVAALSGHAFENFGETTEIVLPEHPLFTTIPSNFMMINGLKELTIPEGITSVGNFAFSQRSITTGAITLERVVLPSTLKVPEPNMVNGTNGNQAFTYWNSPVATGYITDLSDAQKAIFPMTTVVTSTPEQVAWAKSLGYTIEHTYGEPTYTWAADYSTCTATVTCTRGDGATITENVTVTSAGSVHTATFTDSRFATQTVDSSKSMKVLFFGNSYTEDATNNSPMATSKTWEALAALCGENVDPKNVVVGAMTSGGKSMAWHALQAQSNAESYTLRVCEGTDTWKNVPDIKTVDAALAYTDWDFVILQPYTNESHGINDGSENLEDDQGSQNQNYLAAQKFTSLNASCTELLNHIQTKAPQAKTYLYMLWQHNSGDNTNAASTNTGYEMIVSTITAAVNYKSSDGNYGFAGYVPVGTAIQNARTTYLADLRYHVGETVNLANDPVKGMERDSHLTYNIGRYIAGLTFAETLANAKGYTWDESDIPALRVSEAIGKLPDQYWDIAKASVAEAITMPNATTTISGYETDPAVAAKEAIEGIDYSDISVTTASAVKAAVTAKINNLSLPAGVKVGTVTVTSVQPAINTFSATVPVTYGYTTATAMPYAGKQMSYVSGGCMVTFSDDDGDGNYTATVKAIEGGTGVMDNYNVANGGQTLGADQTGKDLPPWLYEWKDYTTKLVIDSSVKGLGGNAFEYMYKIEEVVFPENPQFTYIPGNFMMVNSLKEVTIPEGITNIGPFAFSQRDFKESALTLKKVTLPTSLTSVATTYTRDKNLNQAFTYWNGAGDKTAAEYAASMPYLFSSTTIVPATAAQLTWAEAMGYTVEHVYGEIQYNWTNDFSQCTATLPCTTGDGYKVTETASSTKVGATYTVTFENPLLGSTSISAGTKLPAGLQLVGGTAGNTDYSATKPVVDGTGGNPSVVLEYVAATDVEADVKTDVETAAETFLSADEKVLAVVEANLYINNGGVLTRVTNAELSENIEVLVPYAQAVVGRSYILYHYNGTGFDDSIAAEGVMVSGVKYLKFQYNKFSPFVIVGGVGYNAITATTGEGYTVTYTGMGKTGEDYTFTVTVDSGYTLQSVKANGNAFTATDPTYVKVNDSTYTIKNLNNNYNIEVKVTKDAYTVTYSSGVTGVVTGMPDSVTGIAAGSDFVISQTIPARAGYTFQGWDSDDDGDVDYQPGATITNVTANVTLYAVWAQDKVTVTYPTEAEDDAAAAWNISKHGPQTAIVKDTYETFTVTVAAGYDPATMIVTANGVPLAVAGISGNVYTYKFKATENTTIAVSAPTALTYTISLPVGDSFTATLTKVDSTDVATANQPQTFATIDYGKDYTFTVTAKENYEISAVLVNGVKQPAASGTARTTQTFNISGVAANQTIQVEMKDIIYYTVTYVIDGSQYLTQQVEKGSTITTLITPEARTGYSFSGWYTDAGMTGTTVTGGQTISANTTYYGKYNAQTVQIIYNLNGGTATIANTTKTYGIATTLSSTVPTRTGYTFLGWGLAANGAPAYQPGDTFSAELTANLDLYAIWEQKTVTVTLAPSTGCTAEPAGTSTSLVVKYGETFTFKVTVDPAYNATAPTVSCSGGVTTSRTGTNPYTYTTSALTADTVISINVAKSVKTVTFKYWDSDETVGTAMTVNGSAVYMTQLVDYNAKATQPTAPTVEGYTFAGWYTEAGASFSFGTAITADTTVYAKMVAITPDVTIPDNGTGWTIEFTETDGGAAGTNRTHTHAYNADCTFKVTIAEGYDASNMQVGANGVALAPTKIDGNVYTYKLTGVKVNTTITVVGVVRKTVKITYNDNARDDVSGMPVQQVVKYYVAALSDNDQIVKQYPVRTGYEFLGWSTKSESAAPDTGYAKADIEAGAYAKFTSDTTLYAIWKANSTTITLAVSDVAVAAGTGTNAKEYEGQPVTLTATLKDAGGNALSVSTGSVNFYQNDKLLISVPANGSSTYTTTATTSPYKLDGTPVEDSYQVEYKAEGDEGYGSADKTSPVKVTVLSTAITWKLNTSNAVDGSTDYQYASTIAISGLTPGTAMTAGQTYTLTAPAVYELGTDYATALKVGTDYTITWQYLDGANGWKTLAENQTTSTYEVTSEYSKYQFRALMVVNTGVSTVYTKAAKFGTDEGDYKGALNTTETMSWLISEPTPAVVLQQTTTTLAITGADNELATTKFNGQTLFSNDHWAQFEGQTVTLNAQVKDASDALVQSGKVYFYRYVDGINDVKLNATAVEVVDGVAQLKDVAISDYDTAKRPKQNVDKFYAVYQQNATYDDSSSLPAAGPDVLKHTVYIKSTTIQTPVIKSDLPNANGDKATTYTADLTGLLAGVKHTFTLVVGANGQDAKDVAAAANWSVVALDGRTVAAENYTIQWNVKTGDNTVTDATVGGTFVTTDNKVGDEISVTLIAKNDMKVDATSKKAIIGTKQDVNVTVTASDKIASTSATDAYQLDEVTLTATVAAAEGANATVKPSGTVTFYYSVNGSTWTKVGETTDLDEDAGVITASIKTTELPVKSGDNTKQDVTITAIYSGDKTFNESGTINSTGAITNTTGCTVNNETVTVYSSVVYVNSGVENKAINPVSQSHASGIYIYAEEDKVLANEANVNLKLSDVYTLDHDIPLSKLTDGTEADYTVQWQKLTNAQVEEYRNNYAAAPWQNIEGKTGTICQITVEQGAAYRAVITVKDTPIAKGSYNEVVQTIAGRQVYYSNILVAAPAPATVTVNVNTDKTGDGFEGIVQGETVTIHTFASGATGTTPISELTVTITDANGAEVENQVKTNVNGHVSFDWAAAQPGYYELKVVAKFTNGYDDKTITRELIVRDNDYGFTAAGDNTTYNGKVQGLTVTVDNMGIEDTLAQKSVVVYYYTDANRTQQVEPTQAGTYYATIRLQESAYWTEKTMDTTFTIKQRDVSVVDLIAQAKVYDGTTNANIQEIILNDAETAQTTTGLPTGNTGVINGDSVYAVGTGYTSSENAGTVTLNVKDVTLKGDDAANYKLVDATYTEAFNIQRSQVKGDIADSTFQYTGSNITVPADDIYLIDQAGNVITPANYTVTYYYHSGDGVEKVTAMNKLGKYTVIARPEQNNYKGGASQIVYVAATADDQAPVTTAKSALIDITNTVKLYDGTATGVTATPTKGSVTSVTYNGSATVPSAAGRYLVKVTTDTGDTAYGIYTIVKARPKFEPTTDAAEVIYNSAPYSGTVNTDFKSGKSDDTAETYVTYTGGTIQGIAYEAPTEVGKYIATVHVGETDNYTAHEEQVAFEIKPAPLTITADSLQRHQYGAFPDMTASFDGLAGSAYAPDTSLRDVQIQPELIFNETDGYDNIAMDHVGNEYPIIAIAALARNYDVSYVQGNLSVTNVDANPYLAIHGMIDNGNGGDIAYYGDVIQLYAYGSQSKTTGVINNSSVLTWEVTGPATITQNGLLTIIGVGTVEVKLTRGVGAQKISTTLPITALKKEVKVSVPDEDVVYNAATQTYTVGNMKAYNEKFNIVTGVSITSGNTNRIPVGSQIVTGQVASTETYYQSETYGGLFTINDKEVTVKPVGQTKDYGEALDTLTYTEEGIVTGTAALTNGKAVSIRDFYVNLDVLDGYEILVAGVENMNYNVKYVTDQIAPDAQVTAKPLTFKTGVINSDGRTSGYMKNNSLFYKDEGYAITGTTFNPAPNDRMYGEINPVMDYLFTGLVGSDNEADLKDILDWLVEYSDGTAHNIKGDANVAFVDAHLTGHKSTTYLTGKSAYYIDGMLTTGGVKNYTTTVTEATQNIYQRPVTLKLSNGTNTLDVLFSDVNSLSEADRTAYLRDLIVANLNVLKYTEAGQEVGGLATLLKHTANDLDYELTYIYDANGFNVTIKAINNYWSEDYTIHVNVVKEKYRVVYNSFTATSATVTLYHVNLDTGAETAEFLPSGNLMCKIFTRTEDGSYLGETPVVNVAMQRTSTPGVYTVTYPRLVGSYRMFAIAEGGVGYTIVNGIK